MKRDGLGTDGLPTKESVYLVKIDNVEEEIDVYSYPKKGLCCFSGDLGNMRGAGVDDETDCHISVGMAGLEFISRVRDLH